MNCCYFPGAVSEADIRVHVYFSILKNVPCQATIFFLKNGMLTLYTTAVIKYEYRR